MSAGRMARHLATGGGGGLLPLRPGASQRLADEFGEGGRPGEDALLVLEVDLLANVRQTVVRAAQGDAAVLEGKCGIGQSFIQCSGTPSR